MRTFSVNINIEHLIVSFIMFIMTIYLQGEISPRNYLKDILQYNTASYTWEEVGQMKEARSGHAVAVLDDVSKLCP